MSRSHWWNKINNKNMAVTSKRVAKLASKTSLLNEVLFF